MQDFFEMLPYVLPCKYCRASLSEYMENDPVDTTSTAALTKWLWRIHNNVNNKLRKQGLPTADDPDFSEVKKIYEERLRVGCTRVTFEGWEFLFSVAENHPMSRSAKGSEPMPGVPSEPKTSDEKNRWNLLSANERMPFYEKFWELLPKVLPFEEWRAAWANPNTESRSTTLVGLWRLRCKMEKELELLNKTDYSSLCKELRSHRSGCNAKKRGKTCRKNRVRK